LYQNIENGFNGKEKKNRRRRKKKGAKNALRFKDLKNKKL